MAASLTTVNLSKVASVAESRGVEREVAMVSLLILALSVTVREGEDKEMSAIKLDKV